MTGRSVVECNGLWKAPGVMRLTREILVRGAVLMTDPHFSSCRRTDMYPNLLLVRLCLMWIEFFEDPSGD